jgi:hypothetical protein
MQIGSLSSPPSPAIPDAQSKVAPPAPPPPRVDSDGDHDAGASDSDKGKQVNVVT